MNKASAKRLISKQEACVLLGELDLFTCTETIESTSISNSSALRNSEDEKVNKTFLTKYKERATKYKHLSMYDFFLATKSGKGGKTVIPHFVGISGSPTYPVTETYARHVLTIYRPWTKYPTDCNWIQEFNEFIESKYAPPSAVMHYRRAVCRHFDGTKHYDPKSSDIDHTGNPISDEDQQLIDLLGLHKSDNMDHDTALLKSMERGINYEWDKSPKVRR